MNISTAIVGTTVGPSVHDIDARWLMAYAAALGETAPEYLDTTRAADLLAHPLFPVCYEWPLAVDLRSRIVPEAVAVRGVHASHDLVIHRRPRAGDRLSTTAAVTAVEPRSPGAYVVVRFETLDADRRRVTTTSYGSLYLGVGCDGAEGHPPPAPSSRRSEDDPGPLAWAVDIPIAATLGHVYTECARIWNPIHTDRAVALAAGLPDIILHGTATLALAVSEVLRRQPQGPVLAISRVSCRFGGMVRLPSSLRVEGWPAAASGTERAVAFRARGADGRLAVRDGRIAWTP